MSYQALYRAWRPPSFADLVHQPHVKQTLQNAILRKQVAHAYLFCGPRGTGKTSAAKILAKAVNCLNPQGADPCNECAACRSINNGSNIDVEEIDAASNRGVDEIRQLRDKVQYAPASLKKKVYIVDEVHMLTPEAFNALLKTLEEPPLHVLFILATTEPYKLPETIVSRCQRFDFRRIPEEMIVQRLEHIAVAQGWSVEEEALWHIASAADGGLRDALGYLEQTAAFGEGDVTAENAAHVVGGVAAQDLLSLLDCVIEMRDLPTAMQKVAAWHEAGKDIGRVMVELLHLLRDLFIVKVSMKNGEPVTGKKQLLQPAAEQMSLEWLLHSVKQLGELYAQLRYIQEPRIAFEAALVGLAMVYRESVLQPAGPTNASTAERLTAQRPVQEQSSNDLVESTTSGASTARGKGDDPVQSVGQPAVEGLRKAKVNSQRRKLEALQAMNQDASDAAFLEANNAWAQILQQVKSSKIQTYAWLMGGTPVLATPDTLLVTFGVQIHRDNVMKPDERSLIESAMSAVLGYAMRFQAILQSDWDSFQKSRQATEPSGAAGDWVDTVVQLFGRDRVEIQHDE